MRSARGRGVDYVALSFVQSAADLRQARDALAQAGTPQTPLIAKLERPEAVARIDDILEACDAIMVARGDLGLELPLERVPRVQKEVTRKARARAIPVIVATQVLESMRTEPRPTRAEVSDAANAVDDGVDAIMLAGETAAGKFPVRAVQTLDLVIRDAEQMPLMSSVSTRGDASAVGPGPCALRSGGNACHAQRGCRHRGGDAWRENRARAVRAAATRADLCSDQQRGYRAAARACLGCRAASVRSRHGCLRRRLRASAKLLVERAFVTPSSVIVVVSISPDLAQGPSNF